MATASKHQEMVAPLGEGGPTLKEDKGGGQHDESRMNLDGCNKQDATKQSQNAKNNEHESMLNLQYSSLSSPNESGHQFCDGDDEQEDSDDDDQYEQAMDIFVKHFDHHHLHHSYLHHQRHHHHHIFHQNPTERERERRPSLPTEDIELTTFSGVVMRRKEQLQKRFQEVTEARQQQQLKEQRHTETDNDKDNTNQAPKQQQQHQNHLTLPTKSTKGNRPLSISSISSTASSGSSASSNSSSSSGIHSSLTRNSSLNYSQEFKRNLSYLESAESLDTNTCGSANMKQHRATSNTIHTTTLAGTSEITTTAAAATTTTTTSQTCGSSSSSSSFSNSTIERALKNLSLSVKDSNLAQTRAAILAAGELQRRSFNVHQASTSSPTSSESKLTRINRSFHASLRYDKSTAYRIHLMANARGFGLGGQAKSYNLMGNSATMNGPESIGGGDCARGIFRRYSTISRNNSSTSSDSGHGGGGSARLPLSHCHCGAYRRKQSADNHSSSGCSLASLTSTSAPSSSSSSGQSGCGGSADCKHDEQSSIETARKLFSNKAATLDGAIRSPPTSPAQHFNHHHHHHHHQHHPNCPAHHSNQCGHERPLRASPKLQQSPSSVSSYSNTSSLFRDDGFEDDLTSTTSEHSSSIASANSKANYHHNLRSNSIKEQEHHHSHHHPAIVTNNNNNNNNSNSSQYNRIRIHNDQELPLLSISQRVVTEIIETERSYVDDLEQIVSGYLCRLRDTLDQHQELFSNLEDIYKFNKDFLFQLEECYLNPGSIAACFVENAAKFDVYTHYCTMYPQVVSTLTDLMAQPAAAQILKERQLELNQSLPLGAYLLKPVQRILKYHILFKSLIKHTTDDETVSEKDLASINEAFSVMTNIACHINEMKKRHEHSIRVQELQSLLCGWEGPDLTTLGELILEDTFKLFNRQKSNRHLLLFDNVLLITKKKRDGSLHYKGHIECSNLMLIETIEGQPLVFNTVPFDNPKALCAFQADNLDKKRDWCLQMKEVIIKSFEVKIPRHVRDLLMSLTKTSTTPKAPEGTNNSRKNSSSEKPGRVLRAPNYLEKKRAKQLDKTNSKNKAKS